MQIFLSRNGQRIGPYPVEEVNRQIAAGHLSPSDLGWSEASPGWKPLLSFAGVIMPGGASSSPVSIAIATPTHWEAREYAGFWIRAVALVADAILLGLVWLATEAFIYRWVEEGNHDLARNANIARVAFSVLYFPIAWATARASLGQRMCKLRVIDGLTNTRISFARAIGRLLAMILSGALAGIGFMMAAFTERKRGLHDMLADTCVVKEPLT